MPKDLVQFTGGVMLSEVSLATGSGSGSRIKQGVFIGRLCVTIFFDFVVALVDGGDKAGEDTVGCFSAGAVAET